MIAFMIFFSKHLEKKSEKMTQTVTGNLNEREQGQIVLNTQSGFLNV